jgi:hypothetical protein
MRTMMPMGLEYASSCLFTPQAHRQRTSYDMVVTAMHYLYWPDNLQSNHGDG